MFIVREDGHFIALARAISDDASVVYVQDIFVCPSHQEGLGRALVNAILKRYSHVRQKVLLTDDRPEQLRFYESLGFRNTRSLTRTPLNAFVIIEEQAWGSEMPTPWMRRSGPRRCTAERVP